MEIDFRP